MIAAGDRARARELVEANAVLAHLGVLDAFGHVSVRSAENPGSFLLSRNRAPGLVSEADVLLIDAHGDVVGPGDSYLERYIHSAIYAARPDVEAIVHSHAAEIIPFTVTSVPFRPVMHIAGFLAEGVARFDLADEQGDGTDLLVVNAVTGAQLAGALGDAPVVLMRGHGFVTVADSLPGVVFQAVYARSNARAQLDALALGEPNYLTVAEGRATSAANKSQVVRAWDVWRRAARTARLEPATNAREC